MATVAGTVQNISGKFYAKDGNGNVRELKEGDAVYENETVFGDDANTASQKIEVALQNNDAVNLNANQEQAFDASVIETAFGNEELYFPEQSVSYALRDGAMTDVESDLRDTTFASEKPEVDDAGKDVTEEETAEGEEEAKDKEGSSGNFEARDGAATDIASDLRSASFLARTQVFEDKDAFKSESEDRLGSSYVGTQYTNPFTPPTSVTPPPTSVTPPPTAITTPPPVTPPPVTPPIVKPSAIIKLFAADSNGNVIKDTITGEYLLANEVKEGKAANYIAFAFKEGTTTFNDSTKLAAQAGTIDIGFTNGSAKGATSNPLKDGTEDFNNTPKQNIQLGKSFSTEIFNDAVVDAGEIYTVTIDDDSYKGNAYKEVEIDLNPVTTTILDKDHTVYVIIENTTPTVIEGQDGTYTVKFVDKNGALIEVENDTKVKVKYTNVSTQDDDTNHIHNQEIEVTIKAGKSTSEPFTVETIDDVYKEANEIFNLKITNVDNTTGFNAVIIGDIAGNRKDVNTTIVDNETEIKIVLVATDSSGTVLLDGDSKVDLTKNTNITPEGEKLYYVAVAIGADGKLLTNQGGTVTVTYGNTPDNGTIDDYTATTTVATIGTVFEVLAKDDFYAEGNENFTVKISNPTGTPYEKPVVDTQDTVTSTIQDNPANDTTKNPQETPIETGGYGAEDTVYVTLTTDDSVVEGNTLKHTVTLVDSAGTPVIVAAGETITVTFEYSNDTTENADFKDSKKTTSVTITGGNSSATVENITIDDFVANENGNGTNESYTLTITNVSQEKGTYENVAIHMQKTATGEIKDGVTLGIPKNAKVDEDTFVITDAKPQISVTESLGIQKPNPDNAYTLSFDAEVNNIKVYKGDADSSEIYTGLKSGGKDIAYVVSASGDMITGYAGTGRNESDIAFTIKLNNNSDIEGGITTKDSYTYTQYLNIDHPVSGSATEKDTNDKFKNDDDITFEFGFKIIDQGQISETQKFKVTVNDSMPFAGTKEVIVNEDSVLATKANTFIISQENFKNGIIKIYNGDKLEANILDSDYVALAKEIKTVDGVTTVNTINIFDPNDTSKIIGTLTTKGDGTVTFVPISNYSNYAAKPSFKYQVSDNDGDFANGTVNITVRPIADTPTITVPTLANMPSTTEDDGNAKEGTNKVALGLLAPVIVDSKNQNDGDSTTGHGTKAGDHPERLGHITLTFTNGDKVTGAKLFNDTTQVGTDITGVKQEIKIVIVKTSGGTDIDTDYHHADVTTGQANTLYLTKAEYETLKIQHAEDNDTDIKINIKVTSYEVDDLGKPLFGKDGYADKTLANLKAETTADMVVKIHPVTDNISLAWDKNDSGLGTYTGDKFTFNSVLENTNDVDGTVSIDLKALLSNTSGTTDGTNSTLNGDLDGSEKRSYTISGIPEGTIVTLGGQKAIAGSDKTATLVFNDANNKLADPDFSIEFPKFWSGTITNAEITLKAYDKGVDSGDTAGAIKTETVKFSITVDSVAQQSTIQVGQSVGFEDAGRSKGNSGINADKSIITTSSTIDKPEDGIPLNIKVTSDDKDGSEKFTVTIGEIPDGGAIYYKGGLYNESGFVSGTNVAGVSVDVTGTGWAIIITEFDNANAPKFIPPHNDDSDHTLKVSSVTNDGTSTSAATQKDIVVIVKNIADAPVATELKTVENIAITEDTAFNLLNIYTTPANLISSDSTEELTVKIKLTAGFTVKTGSPYYIEDGEYVVKASDIIANKIFIDMPTNFSGDASFDLTYVTTEKAGEGDSKTWNTQTVNIFVKPVADNVTVATGSTIHEDADGSANKINLKPSLTDTDGSETITSVKILASSVGAGYELFLGSASGTPIASKLVDGYYVLTLAEADSVYAKNIASHKVSGNFDLTVVYTTVDAKGTATHTDSFTHTHTVTVKAVTDVLTIAITSASTTHAENVGTVGVKNSGHGVGIRDSGTKIIIWEKDTSFTVSVKNTSPDSDGSETVQRIEIHGVPKGVTIDGASFQGYTGTDSGVWIIYPTAANNTISGVNGASADIKFNITAGANFEGRDMTIKTITKDVGAEERSASTNLRMDTAYTYEGPGAGGSTPNFELVDKIPDISEEKAFKLSEVFEVSYTAGTVAGSHWAADFTDLEPNTTFKIKDGATGVNLYEYTDAGGKLHYVISGSNQNQSDVNSVFERIEIITPKDVNSGQESTLKGDFKITGTISSTNGAYAHQGSEHKLVNLVIKPVTDEMTIAVEVANTAEDVATNLKITLSNPNDGSKTELLNNSITIKIIETWKDDAQDTGTGKGTLTDTSGKYNVTYNSGTDTYTITPKNAADNFKVDTAITGLKYTPASNRDGDVKFEVSVKNKETGSSVTLDSTGKAEIKVTPVIDAVLNATTVIATGTEDQIIAGVDLANPVKLVITADAFPDKSEKIGNIILDEVPNGFTVWYNDGTNLVMATNIGTTGGGTFDLTPNISGDADATRNKWLVPTTGGVMPDIYINAPENWAGDFNFKAQISIKEENLSTAQKFVVPVTGTITPVADGATIDPTKTFGDAFSWIDLKLNANMKDVDGSEVMNLELGGLGKNAQFKLAGGALFVGQEDTSGQPKAVYDNGTWKLSGIAFDQINNVQFTNDKSGNVTVKATTTEIGTILEGKVTDGKDVGNFDLTIKDAIGNFKLEAGVSLNFDNLDAITTLKGVNTIDLSEAGKNELLNLTLSDVLKMSDDLGQITIKGIAEDIVSFKNDGNTWSKGSVVTENSKSYDTYTNSADSSVLVKVETTITDGITS